MGASLGNELLLTVIITELTFEYLPCEFFCMMCASHLKQNNKTSFSHPRPSNGHLLSAVVALCEMEFMLPVSFTALASCLLLPGYWLNR